MEEIDEFFVDIRKKKTKRTKEESINLFDALLELEICNMISENDFKINEMKFRKSEIMKYRRELMNKISELERSGA